jgi:NTP pyrophosphatase (non-canonical NTP hydrolase)
MNIKEIQQEIHKVNVEKGFWDEDRNVGEMLMLVTSELGEAIEAHRKGRFADMEDFSIRGIDRSCTEDFVNDFEYDIKDTFEDEIADAVIRLLDLAAGLNINLERHISLKMQYNETRPYKHGKKY